MDYTGKTPDTASDPVELPEAVTKRLWQLFEGEQRKRKTDHWTGIIFWLICLCICLYLLGSIRNVALVISGVVLIGLMLWKLPQYQVSTSAALTDDVKFDRENEARKTLATILGGLFLLAGLYSSVQTLGLQRDSQITDRFTKAVEQLGEVDTAGKPKVEVRVGAIYALGRIAQDSEKDHWVIVQLLETYLQMYTPVRDETNGDENGSPDRWPGQDIQAIVNVLGTRNAASDKGYLDLQRLNLDGLDFGRKNFSHALFSYSHLTHATFDDSDLRSATFNHVTANLSSFRNTNLGGANIGSSTCRICRFNSANLSGVGFEQDDLQGAVFDGVDMKYARVKYSILRNTAFDGNPKLVGVYFFETDLTSSSLRESYLQDCSIGSHTILPSGFHDKK